ncbi:cysteine desulfurase [Hydrogenispora ethanolica]|jgi:cysteine desulfurase|uniref:cysteine desulfurase n=1 Tax=Hydrogenispora ethanolica TaxID=1082276 RepID=A0A4R1RC03_HYDET|nr:cysteine desulfurase family protein [Hydrogenispora ethanolica]TCL63335.1 cysteine desulfurase [Hydrogenispora ethanolica]
MIYLDYNATTPIANEVAQEMQPYIGERFGNPSSNYDLGVAAKKAVADARAKVAGLLNCLPEEIVFTSGGSESNNSVIKGVAFSLKDKGNHIITSRIEHPAVLNPCKYLEKLGYEITYLPVDEYGLINVSDLKEAITPKTILVTIMHANNETGTLQPIAEISAICHKHNVLLHTDAAQSVGKISANVVELGVDFLTVAGHKLYAPKGVGALFIKKGVHIEPFIHGAGQENGRRAGTENVIFAAALGKACEVAKDALTGSINDNHSIRQLEELTRYFYLQLVQTYGDKIKLNGHPQKRLPNTLNISFVGYNAGEIINKFGDVAVSTGSACHSGLTSISPVLKAMGVSEAIGRSAIRFSLGRYTTRTEMDTVLEKLEAILI